MSVGISKCGSCGYEWYTGKDGRHSCSDHLNKKLHLIAGIVDVAEGWCEQQLLPQESITLAALKDIRRVVRG